MKKTNIISKILYAVTRVLAWLYFFTAIYGFICSVTKTNIKPVAGQTIIEYPFTDVPFLILNNSTPYLVFSFLLPTLAYALFFWLLSNVFQVFYQQKLFTVANIAHLKRFYAINLFLPILLVIISSFFTEIEREIYMIIALHMFLGIFIFIISEIFQQGLDLQNEQDLYI
ncbi:DUF2975 domain-containing protein [Galbibacter pacificus]|uniref:DUF2975 domain-containing protein n=1 Tax=Galbibacter pacificus TaxID=2996052 RepID=A0ABT6FU38_9FLAO|nr:DUF2975 domain-containing protein [Galbibacter pacificus]MDG3583146.1 DUF2975 domain-containing protein [Galbibacter pacificus]MDG3586627.1 DUF2975 domain-containing protein [Galbibacter pacificus]